MFKFKSELGRKYYALNHALPALNLAVGAAGELTLRGEVDAHTSRGDSSRTVEETADDIPPNIISDYSRYVKTIAFFPHFATDCRDGSPVLPASSPGYKENVANPALSFENDTLCKSTIALCKSPTHGAGRIKHSGPQNCGANSLFLTCPQDGTIDAKILFCGYQYCSRCGQYWSSVHQRRFSKLLPKAKKLPSMGVLTIEWPYAYRTKKQYAFDVQNTIVKGKKRARDLPLDVCTGQGLRNVTAVIVRVLRGVRTGSGPRGGFFERGMHAWHFFGDYVGLIDGNIFNVSMIEQQEYSGEFDDLIKEYKKLGGIDLVINPAKDKRSRAIYAGDLPAGRALVKAFANRYHFDVRDYKSIAFNPHWNGLVDGAYVDKLEQVKAELRRELHCPKLIVNYDYVDEADKMVNKLKYVSRATYLDEGWFPELSKELYNFRNIRYWGKWDNLPDQWHTQGEEIYETINKLEHAQCQYCGTKMVPGMPGLKRTQYCIPGILPTTLIDLYRDAGRIKALGASYFEVLPGPVPLSGPDLSGMEQKPDYMTNYVEEHLRLALFREMILQRSGGQMNLDIHDNSKGY